MSVNSPTNHAEQSDDTIDTSTASELPTIAAIKQARRRYQTLLDTVGGYPSGRHGRPAKSSSFRPALWNAESAFQSSDTDLVQASSVISLYRMAKDAKTIDSLEKLYRYSSDLLTALANKAQLASAGLVATLAVAQTAPLWQLAVASGESDYLAACAQIAKQNRTASAQHQLIIKSLGIELGITLCYLRNDAAAVDDDYLGEEFESLIEASLDGDGFPNGDQLPEFGFVAASWVRSFHLLRGLGLEFESQTALQFEWLVAQCLRLSRHDGRLSFSTKPESKSNSEAFWKSLAAVSEDADDKKLFAASIAVKGRPKSAAQQAIAKADRISLPSNFSEWGRGAVLRSSWSPKSPKVAVNFASVDGQPRCDLEIGRSKELIGGRTLPTWRVDEQIVELAAEMEIVCETADEDLDYLELQSSTGQGRFNRQLLLSRNEQFLLVCDSLILEQPGKIHYHCDWPLANAVEPMAESETREIYLNSVKSKSGRKKIQSLVLPLSLPEWKAQPFDGKLTFDSQQLSIWQQRTGQAMLIPIVFDLDPARSRRKRTWRQLTVAQDRNPVPDDQAMAFRFQLGQQQWFFYRALASTGNRTYLGENTIAEFVFNRFEKHGTGQVTQLIEIDG